MHIHVCTTILTHHLACRPLEQLRKDTGLVTAAAALPRASSTGAQCAPPRLAVQPAHHSGGSSNGDSSSSSGGVGGGGEDDVGDGGAAGASSSSSSRSSGSSGSSRLHDGGRSTPRQQSAATSAAAAVAAVAGAVAPPVASSCAGGGGRRLLLDNSDAQQLPLQQPSAPPGPAPGRTSAVPGLVALLAREADESPDAGLVELITDLLDDALAPPAPGRGVGGSGGSTTAAGAAYAAGLHSLTRVLCSRFVSCCHTVLLYCVICAH
jgi:hypothetical protein